MLKFSKILHRLTVPECNCISCLRFFSALFVKVQAFVSQFLTYLPCYFVSSLDFVRNKSTEKFAGNHQLQKCLEISWDEAEELAVDRDQWSRCVARYDDLLGIWED